MFNLNFFRKKINFFLELTVTGGAAKIWCSKKKKKRKICGKLIEVRTGTFFEGSHLTAFQILGFVSFWVHNVTLEVIIRELGICRQTAVDWSSFCREVVFDAMVVKSHKLGGVGRTVEIDESKFGRRKYHRGHRVEGQWVFGGYERDTGRVFMVPVEDRGSKTLLDIIKHWIEPGTTIISDYWKAYDCLGQEGFEHLKVICMSFKFVENLKKKCIF